MAHHLEDGHRKAYCLSLIPISPQTCMNGPAKLSRQMVMFNMKYQIGRKTSRRAKWIADETHIATLHLLAATTSNTGAVSHTSPSARERMDMLTVIATLMYCESKPILT